MQRTYKCPCSVRVLEAFVRDFTGLELRQRPYNVRTRQLSTRPALAIRHSASQRVVPQTHSVDRSLHDTFVPFDSKLDQSNTGGIQTQNLDELESPIAELQTDSNRPEELENLADFEPEVIIHEDGANAAEHPPVLEATDEHITGASRSVDAIAFPDLLVQNPNMTAGTLQRLDIFPPKTREERRKERKTRRSLAKKEEQAEAKVQEGDVKQYPGKNRAKKERRKLEAALAGQDQHAATAAAIAAWATPSKSSTEETTTPKKAAKTPEEKALLKKQREQEKAALKKAKEEAATLAAKERLKSKELWQRQKLALEEKFGEQTWNPRKRISPDALAGIRALHAKSPDTFSTPVLADHFKVAPEAVRRILKSKWQPSEDEAEDRRKRWEKRGERKWAEMAEQGLKPPKKWRDRGVGKAAPGEAPAWKTKGGKPGERWVESVDADGFVVAADLAAEDALPEMRDDGIADRIL